MAEELFVNFDSISEMAKVAKKHTLSGEHTYAKTDGTYERSFKSFAQVTTWQEVEDLSIDGWEKESATALDIAASAIETVERTVDMPHFKATWGTSGCEVDIDRYLTGEPENMIDYEMTTVPRSGRVIVLCASGSASGAVSAEAIKRRGHIVTSLAFALTQLGYAVELYVDLSIGQNYGGYETDTARIRTLVKGANDELDPGRIMFAYSHPAYFRALGFAVMHSFPQEWQDRLGVGSWYGYPADPKEDLPEGTIYLPSVLSDRDIPNADEALLGYLKELGIVDE